MLINSPNISGSLNVSGNTVITGSLTTSIAALNTPATTFLTSNNGTIRSRTAAQTLSDIGAQATGSYLTVSNASNLYVPYTGATASVNLGYNSLAASNINIDGNAPTAGSYLGFKQATTVNTGVAGYTSISTFGTNRMTFSFAQPTGFRSVSFTVSEITQNVSGGRVYTMPDSSGTLALTSNLGAYLPLTGGTITGSLTVTGDVIAQTLNVQEVTSSIVYSSGSNVFGNSVSNTQQFTGSVNITGSLSVTTNGVELQVTNTGVNIGNIVTDNHNVTGSLRISGSLTVNGTSSITGAGSSGQVAYFNGTSTIIGSSNFAFNSSESNLTIQRATSSLGSAITISKLSDADQAWLAFRQGGGSSGTWRLGYTGGVYDFTINAGSDASIGTQALRISTSGTATFSTTENQGGLFVTSATDNTTIRVASTATGGQEWRLQSTGGTSGLGQGKLIFKVGGTETASHIPLTLTTDNSTNGGRVGIGTTSPSYKLEIQQTTTTAALWVQTGGTTSASTIADFRTGTNLPALRILGDGEATFGAGVTATNGFFLPVANVAGVRYLAAGENTNTGTTGRVMVLLQNSANSLVIEKLSTGFTSSGVRTQAGSAIYDDGAGGMSIGATNVSGTLRLFAGNAERLRIANDGDLTVGNGLNNEFIFQNDGTFSGGSGASTIFRLNYGNQTIAQINNTGTGQRDAIFKLLDENAIKVNIAANNSRGGATYFNGGGNFGIGLDNPLYLLHIPQNNNLFLSNLFIGGTANNPRLSSGATGGSMSLEGGGAEEGKIYLQGAGSGGNGYIEFSAGGSLRMTISDNGSIGAPSGTNIFNPSDLRLKRNITTISNGLDKISALNPIKFNWIDGFEPSEDGKDMLGFVAQEVYEVIPEAVESFSGNSILVNDIEIDNPLRVNEKFIIPVLVKAIQELKAENDTLKSRIDTLEQA